jgi:exopolysaccharide biosynthesis protein
MRGPKIAVGIGKKGELKVLAVNGRIRESVGATHIDMADILKDLGMHKAMGFDPGGSSTLYVNGEIMNISPYNKRYEKDIFSLPPQPRFVSNIILGWAG